MDIQLKKKPWYVRYRLYLAGGVLLLAGLIYVIILASGPQRFPGLRRALNGML